MKKKKYQKYFTATIAATVAASGVSTLAPNTTSANTSFSDVPSNYNFYKEVTNLAERGIIKGFEDGTFRPGDHVTRGQAAKIIAGALGLDTKNVKNPGFKDIPTSHQYYGAIAALANAGIISGYEDNTYRPGEPVQRNHMAKILAGAFELKPSTNSLPFTDVRSDYKNYISALYENGVTTGKTATTFDGSSNVTRGQLAAFVIRAENVKPSDQPEQQDQQLTLTIESVSNNTIQTSEGELNVASSLTPIFHSKNATALKGAKVTAVVSNGVITEVSSLTFNASGTEGKAVVFDGGNTTIQGAVTVNADFVALNNVTVAGNVTLTDKVVTDFSAEGLTANGELIIEEGAADQVASVNGFIAAESTKGPKIDLKKSKVKSVHAKRNNISLSSDTKLSEVKVSAKVSMLEINADAEKITINTTVNLEIKGKGAIDQVTIEQTIDLLLNLVGQIKELVTKNKDKSIELGANVTIETLVIPTSVEVSSIIKNYNSVKEKIKKVKDDKGSEVNPGNSWVGGGSGGWSGGGQNKNFTLSIMHTNDTHASLDNIAKTVTAVKEVRAEKPSSLLLNAGDVFSGTLYFNEFQGQADLAFMNLMKYDAMTFGNHEFDLGSSDEGHQGLIDFIKGAQFPFVSSNVDFSKDEKFQGLFTDLISSEPENGKIYNGIIKEINGEKVGIFGLTTAETKDLSSPGAITFEDYKAEAEKAVKAFEGQGVDKIIAITHIGYDDNAAIDNDLTLAKEVEGIDVIVGGHSHTTLSQPVVIAEDATPTVIVQTGANNSNLGVLDVEFDQNGVITKQAGELIAIGDQEEDAEAKALLAPYKEQVDKLAQEEIGVTAEVALENPRTGDVGNTTGESVRKNETVLGNLITDGMLAKAKKATNKNVIMALQNGGGIRAAIDAGPITVGEVIKVLPFGNTLAVMDVTGAELKEAFEISVGKYPGENGGFLHVAGGRVQFDASKPAGERVISVEYKDADGNYVEVQDDVMYTVATNAFTAQGGDGFTVFKKAYDEGRVTDLGLSDWENFREHLQSLETIPTETEGRIVNVAGTDVEPEPITGFYNSNPENLIVSQIARYDSGVGSTGTEILAYDAERQLAFVTNGAVSGFDIILFSSLKTGEFTDVPSTKRVLLSEFGIENVNDITSIASHPTKDLIAITAVSDPKTNAGYVVFASKDGKYISHVQVGALPDMVTFTPDGTKAIVANEGEPAEDYSADPEGSITIIDLQNNYDVITLTFTESLLDDEVRINSFVSSSDSALVQLEPEYITVSNDSKTAYVSLQENNAIATVDLENGEILSVKGLGVKDHSVEGNEIDAHNKDGINIQKLPLLSFYMPDAIDTFTVGGKTYIITPNEGDARDWDAYSEETELKEIADKIKLNAENYQGYTQEELDAFIADGGLKKLEKIKLTKENGLNENGEYEALYAFGGRSFSIFDAETMDLVFDSGSDFEKIIAEKVPQHFNVDNEEVEVDNRSDNKGPEPESAVVGEIDGKLYAFIGLERFSGIMVYDLTDVNKPEFVTLISSRDFSENIKGDVSPEGLVFVSAEESPTGKALLMATHEVSGTVAVYEFGKDVPVQEIPEDAFSGTASEPKVYEGNVKVTIKNAAKLENATIKGDLILVGTPSETFEIINVKVEGNADLSGLEGDSYNFDGLEVTGNTTF
ncbi:choice-of-anchor I family protein [Lysinibacillus telephonicus]|uniref:choice-of-anchor I family protein n=1 Tax=Lysinibacillus telephonicus TaxID=1714840 RepID=UPI0031FE225C